MKNRSILEDFNNILGEMRRLGPNEYPILPIGVVSLEKGTTKYDWSIYENDPEDTTAELYKDENSNRYKIVLNSGTSPLGNIKKGKSRDFVHDQTHSDLFYGVFQDYIIVSKLKEWIKKYNIKSATMYVYK